MPHLPNGCSNPFVKILFLTALALYCLYLKLSLSQAAQRRQSLCYLPNESLEILLSAKGGIGLEEPANIKFVLVMNGSTLQHH